MATIEMSASLKDPLDSRTKSPVFKSALKILYTGRLNTEREMHGIIVSKEMPFHTENVNKAKKSKPLSTDRDFWIKS